MHNILNIVENRNKLSLDGDSFDLVSNSSNFYVKFILDEEWSACEIVTAVFEMKDRTVYVELDENRMCQIPRASAPIIAVCITASPSETEKLSSTRLWLKVCPCGETDLENVEEYQNMHVELLGLIQKISNGDIEVRNSINARESQNAQNAAEAVHAENADNAVFSENAENSLHAESSTTSDRATSADSATYATNANHATSADSATYATNANHATSADSATHATSADSATSAANSDHSTYAERAGVSETQVSLVGDEQISGIKNFVGELLTGGETVVNRTQISNPNLLLNGNFVINQRGLTSYTRSSSNIYTVDRWELYDRKGTFNAQTKTLTGADSGGATTLCQWIENSSYLKGHHVTFSAKINGNVVSGTAFLPETISGNPTYVIASGDTWGLTLVYSSSNSLFRANILVTNGNSIVVDDAKLELGDYATQFCPRPYGEELLLCQRYYTKFKGYGTFAYLFFGIGMVHSATKAYVCLPAHMRTSPTIQYTGTFYILHGNVTPISSISINAGETNSGIWLEIAASGLIVGRGCALYSSESVSANMCFDAEIY